VKKLINQMRFTLGHCHRLPDRSFHFKGIPFPVCARCTGVYAGQALMVLGILVGVHISFWVGLILMEITFADWIIYSATSSNIRRFITGLPGGVGYIATLVNISIITYKWIFH